MEWYGMVWKGMEWYGMVWKGMEWYGMVWNGMDWYGYGIGLLKESGKAWVRVWVRFRAVSTWGKHATAKGTPIYSPRDVKSRVMGRDSFGNLSGEECCTYCGEELIWEDKKCINRAVEVGNKCKGCKTGGGGTTHLFKMSVFLSSIALPAAGITNTGIGITTF